MRHDFQVISVPDCSCFDVFNENVDILENQWKNYRQAKIYWVLIERAGVTIEIATVVLMTASINVISSLCLTAQ